MCCNVWQEWRKTGIIPTNQKLLHMMQDVVNAYRSLIKIDQGYYMMVCDNLVAQWHTLQGIAFARGIKDYPSILQKD